MEYRGYDISPETVTRVDGGEQRVGFIGRSTFPNPVVFEDGGSKKEFYFDVVEASGRKVPVETLKRRIKRRIDGQHESFEEQSGYKLDPRILDKR